MSGIPAGSSKVPGLISSIALPTGSTMSHQPPGGGLIASMGAGNRGTGGHILPQPVRSRSGTRILPPPVRLSTSSRPIGAVSPSFPRFASPPQPPPLPPPPPSPQLVPLKARLARSRSVSSHPTSSPLGTSDRASQQRWDVPTASSRRAAFGHNQSRSLKESLYDGSGGDELPSSSLLLESAKTVEKIEPVPYSSPSVFLPVVHPRERNVFTVLFASFIFLSVSLLITGLFSTVVLPLCLLACLIRRLGIWSANLYQPLVCCRCNRLQLPVNSMNPLALFFARQLHQMNDLEHVCQCPFHDDGSHNVLQALRPLTPAELRWLPAYDCKSLMPDPSFGPSLRSPRSAPLIMICLRFGAPGLELVKLREVIGARLLKGYSAPSSSSASSLRESSLGDGQTIGQRERACPFVPPSDTLSRLTQCLTRLSTGYAWRECLAFRLEDHVIHVPAACLPKPESSNLSKSYRPSSFSHVCGSRNSGQPAPVIKVDSLVKSLSELPLLPNRPLWQAYLLEQYQEVDDSEPSDADSAAETDEAGHPKGRWSRLTVDADRGHRFKPDGSSATELKLASSSSSFVCRRSGSAGIGSLLIFRLHAALSDDGKALAHLLTNCLADLPSPAHSPSRASMFTCKIDDPREMLEQSSHRRWRGHYSPEETNQSYESVSPAGNSVQPSSNHVMQNGFPTESTGNSDHAQVPNSSHLLQHNPEITAGTIATPRITMHASSRTINNNSEQPLVQSEDEDPEEKEAAQWWFTFWSSSLATIATFCDLVRAILTGPAIILHKYFFTRADMGILVKHKGSNATTPPSNLVISGSSSHVQGSEKTLSPVYKCMLLSLVKLSRVRQVTKASYSEIILSLLAGALRAYHQSAGLQHPPDLLAFLSVEVPALPSCPITQTQQGSLQHPPVQRSEAPSNTTPWPGHRLHRLWTSATDCRHQPESLAEAGLLGNNNRIVAISPPLSTTNSLCPGRHVLADICLPINTEGMLPRLWETRQRLIELNNSVDPLCLAWARTILYTLMPHPMAAWLEANHGSSAKASVSVTGVDVVSPFSWLACHSKDQDRGQTYQMPPTRRLAYMSILASKSAEARSLRRRLRKRLPRGASVYPPRLGTSFRALARHLTNANAGLVYIAGSPVVRIDTWMPSPRLLGAPPSPEIIAQPTGAEISITRWSVCRDLSVAFTTYAGQLSLTFSGTMASECYPNLDLVLHAIKIQLRNMCHLLAGRHVPATVDRWLHCGSHLEARNTAREAVNLSPSLNPNLMLRQEPNPTSVATRSSAKPPRPLAPTRGAVKSRSVPHSHPYWAEKLPDSAPKDVILEGTNRRMPKVSSTEKLCMKPSPKCTLQPKEIGISLNSLSSQSVEQLQERLRTVQQLLNDSATVANPSSCVTECELANLRAEFSIIIRELNHRCNITSPMLPQKADSLWCDNHCQEGTTSQHRSDRNPLSRQSRDKNSLRTSTNIYNRIPRCSTEFILPLVKLAHVKVTSGSENTAQQCAHCSFTSGDFDEGPDFYIGGSDEEDDFDDEITDVEPSDPIISSPFALPKTNPTSDTMRKRPLGFKNKLNDILHPYQSKLTYQKGYRFRQRHRRGQNNVNHRRSSLLSTDVSSLDITPNRRGSLGGTTSVPAMERILYKWAKPKRANALPHTPEPVSWTKVC